MEINWDAFGGITQIITLWYLYYQFHYLPKKARKEALINLEVLFRLSQNKLDKLINDLTAYYVVNNCENSEFTTGVTFLSQVRQLVYLQVNDLNEEVKKNVLKLAESDALIATMVDSINKQIFSFTQLEAHFNSAFRFKQPPV